MSFCKLLCLLEYHSSSLKCTTLQTCGSRMNELSRLPCPWWGSSMLAAASAQTRTNCSLTQCLWTAATSQVLRWWDRALPDRYSALLRWESVWVACCPNSAHDGNQDLDCINNALLIYFTLLCPGTAPSTGTSSINDNGCYPLSAVPELQCTWCHAIFQLPHWVGTFIIPPLEVREVKLREIKLLGPLG